MLAYADVCWSDENLRMLAYADVCWSGKPSKEETLQNFKAREHKYSAGGTTGNNSLQGTVSKEEGACRE
jgi:hypothetical protein